MTDRAKIGRLLPTLKQAYESLGDAVNIVDGDNRLVFVNSTWLGMYGYSKEEVANRGLSSMFSGDQVVVDDEMVRDAPDEKWEGEVERTRKNGEQFTAHLTVTFLRGSKGERLGRIAIVRDLTDLKNKEYELELKAKHESALASIGRIVGSSLDISDVFREVAEKIQNIIDHDRLTLVLVDYENDENATVFEAGMTISAVDRSPRKVQSGGLLDLLKKKKSSLIINAHTAEEWANQFPRMEAKYFGGFKSTMASPIFFDGKLVGELILRSLTLGVTTNLTLNYVRRLRCSSLVRSLIQHIALHLRGRRQKKRRSPASAG